LKLYKGNIIPAGFTSPFSLYDPDLGGFSDVETYDQKDATGFIRCFGLPLKMRGLLLGKKTNVKFGQGLPPIVDEALKAAKTKKK